MLVCNGSIGIFQSIKRTSIALWQRIKAAVTHVVIPTRQDRTGTDVHQQTDTHAVAPTRQDRTGTNVHQQTDTHAVTPTRQDSTCTDVPQQTDTHAVALTRQDRTGTNVHQQTDTHAVTPTRQDSTITDVHQHTDTLNIHTNTTHTSSTCSYNTASTSIRSVSSEFFTASSPSTPVKPQKGTSSSMICACVRGSSSHGIEYSRGQYILGGSFNLEVLAKLGEGGFGTIYKVRGRDSIYAAKVSKSLRLEDVHEEFATLSDLSHSNIVHAMEKLSKGYLMEYCPNDLDHLIKDSGPVKLETCFDISIGIARATSYIHSQYLAHLDIKPRNILLTESMSPKLADFGESMYFRKQDGSLRLLNHTASTFGYAPPEMLDFKSGINMARMDSWCLGATFFEMVTGRRPFKGETKEELLSNQLRRNFDLPRRFVHKNTFSSEYMAVIRNLCTVKPKTRISPAEAKHRLKGNQLFMMLNAWDREDPCY